MADLHSNPIDGELFGFVVTTMGALFFACVLASGYWFAWAMAAPRALHGRGAIPEGCGPLQDALETLWGPGDHPVCWKPGVARTTP